MGVLCKLKRAPQMLAAANLGQVCCQPLKLWTCEADLSPQLRLNVSVSGGHTGLVQQAEGTAPVTFRKSFDVAISQLYLKLHTPKSQQGGKQPTIPNPIAKICRKKIGGQDLRPQDVSLLCSNIYRVPYVGRAVLDFLKIAVKST